MYSWGVASCSALLEDLQTANFDFKIAASGLHHYVCLANRHQVSEGVSNSKINNVTKHQSLHTI